MALFIGLKFYYMIPECLGFIIYKLKVSLCSNSRHIMELIISGLYILIIFLRFIVVIRSTLMFNVTQ